MKRGKRLILIAVMVVIVLGATIGGITLAQADDEDSSPRQTIIARVAEILGIDQQELENAFGQARSEIVGERRDHFRHMWLEEGEISDELRGQIKEWLESRPDFLTDEFKEWMESRPEGFPFGPDTHGQGRYFGGFGKFGGGFRGCCVLEAPIE